ncbi:hypothetical protein SAMN04488595_11817 [Ralstonia sp. 25mfcol4.1]|uniref:hypothetical protein n=1 Tax=Ralstonia sp. 25mfcol4.1 TaxID=1761899 RepID=UPI00088A1B4B|nr:hypothetical protein [Ralstonia sp. 25mfcol4.1]SDP72069.1 hypothetical protein SAMN04488595_11817 [Ralstonia sp. 25mfcol4.1]
MLSAHEIAALMVLGSLGSCRDIDPRDLAALATRRLIDMANAPAASPTVHLTPAGYQMLGAVHRASRARSFPRIA